MGILNNIINNIITNFSKNIRNNIDDNNLKSNNEYSKINFPDGNLKNYIEQQMLISIHNINNKSLDDFSYDDIIDYLNNLKIIVINWKINNETFKNYCEFFKTLPKLDTLGLSNCGVTDFSPLNDLHNIQYLDISYNNLENINFLSNLKYISYLNISNNNIKSLLPLRNTKNIINIDFSNNNISYIMPILNNVNLKEINANNNNIIKKKPNTK